VCSRLGWAKAIELLGNGGGGGGGEYSLLAGVRWVLEWP
jgi:hypothetical protein